MKISVIIPIYNEEKNIAELCQRVKKVLSSLTNDYEIIAINDGSIDNTHQVLRKISNQDKNFKVVNFRKNFGQTAAISAGIDISKGEMIIPIDADLENLPEDIPDLLNKFNEGYDVVSGWRKDRWKKNYLPEGLLLVLLIF